jgi:hypothetical protein
MLKPRCMKSLWEKVLVNSVYGRRPVGKCRKCRAITDRKAGSCHSIKIPAFTPMMKPVSLWTGGVLVNQSVQMASRLSRVVGDDAGSRNRASRCWRMLAHTSPSSLEGASRSSSSFATSARARAQAKPTDVEPMKTRANSTGRRREERSWEGADCECAAGGGSCCSGCC